MSKYFLANRDNFSPYEQSPIRFRSVFILSVHKLGNGEQWSNYLVKQYENGLVWTRSSRISNAHCPNGLHRGFTWARIGPLRGHALDTLWSQLKTIGGVHISPLTSPTILFSNLELYLFRYTSGDMVIYCNMLPDDCLLHET